MADDDNTGAGKAGLRDTLAVIIGYLFVPFSIRLSNTVLYPLFDAVMPLAREVNVGTGVLASLLVVMVALHAPRLLRARALGVGAALLALAGFGLMAAGLATGSPALLCAGAMVRSFATSWTSLLASVACCTLSLRWLFAGVPAATLGGYVLAWAVAGLSAYAALVALALAPLVSYVCCRTAAEPIVGQVAEAPAQDGARLMRPASYLPLTSRMFVCMFLATAAIGFNLRIGPVEGGAVSPLASLVPLAALAALGWLATHARLYDLTFRVGITLAVAAFLVFPLKSYLPLAQDLLAAAGACFDTLFVLVMVAAAARNRLSAVTVVSWGALMTTLGSIVGANLGAFVGANTASEAAFLASAAVATALLAYALFGLAGFSFADTIEGIEPVEPLQVPPVSDADRFQDACARVAQAGGLTPRETEVLALLARGRNNAFVQEELTLTRNTVKAYIKHIYAKLNVHSQQELIDLVERG